MSSRDEFENEEPDEEQPRPRRKRADSDLSSEQRSEEAPISRRPRKAPERAWNDAEQKVKARSKKTSDNRASDSAKTAKRSRTKPKEKASPKPVDRGKWRNATFRQRLARIRWIFGGRYAPAWLFAILLLAYFVPRLLRPGSSPIVAPVYTQEVQHWAPNIAQWSKQYGVNANLIATLMQIESCGFPGATSYVGAQGLFQVMPFNFSESDQDKMTDIETNAKTGVGVLRDCLRYADGDVGLAMACYNGGPGLISRDPKNWPLESQHYYTWGTGIYNDAVRGLSTSPTLQDWLQSGGVGLCEKAATVLDLTPSPVAPVSNVPPTVSSATQSTQSGNQPNNQPTFPPAPPPVIVASPVQTATLSPNGTAGAPSQTPTLGIRLFLTPTPNP